MGNPAENKFVDPNEILKQLSIVSGSIVADFGCGAGYFSIPVAKLVGDEGVVHALDILPQSLESVQSRAKIMGLTNVRATRVNLEKDGGSKLPDNSLDLAILKDMLFQNKGKDIILREAHRTLKPGGKLLIMEWSSDAPLFGPEAALRIDKPEMLRILEAQGFTLDREIEAGTFHYGMLASK